MTKTTTSFEGLFWLSLMALKMEWAYSDGIASLHLLVSTIGFEIQHSIAFNHPPILGFEGRKTFQ
jgi:hypothetical protein